jgi:hypothetical protein
MSNDSLAARTSTLDRVDAAIERLSSLEAIMGELIANAPESERSELWGFVWREARHAKETISALHQEMRAA